MIKVLLYKWFGLVEPPCSTCEVLRLQLDESNRERRELLNRLLVSTSPEPVQEKEQELVPIKSNFIPWRVRQQLLEQEDRQEAKLIRERRAEIEKLEKELGIAKDESAPSGGVKVNAGNVR